MASDHDVAFPTLSDKDLTALAARGHAREVHTGELLFEEGERNLSFFVVQEGAVEILEHSRGTPHTVVVHHPGQFTGDVVSREWRTSRSIAAVVTGLDGNGHLSAVHVKNGNGEQQTFETNSLYLFIGADPNTNWLPGCVELDKKGFVLTGTSLQPSLADAERWRVAGRSPFLLETSLPGVFAAGDVRAGSAKRVASAVGEGAMAVSFVHAHIGRPV